MDSLARAYRRDAQVVVHQVALSDTAGVVDMRVPAGVPNQSTIETSNALPLAGVAPSQIASVEVPAERLDAFDLRSVGFIKIDVEGHEVAVLEGARATIRRERPSLVVEATDLFRPDSIADCRAFFESMDYGGYFLMEGRLLPIDRFLPSYQDPDQREDGGAQAIHMRNFIFVPDERGDLVRAIEAKLGRG